MPIRPSLAVTAHCLVALLATGHAAEKPRSGCSAVKHLREDKAEYVVVRAVFVQYHHGLTWNCLGIAVAYPRFVFLLRRK